MGGGNTLLYLSSFLLDICLDPSRARKLMVRTFIQVADPFVRLTGSGC